MRTTRAIRWGTGGVAGLAAIGAWFAGAAGSRAGAPWPDQAQPEGERLVASLGCGACHEGVPEAEEIRLVSPAMGDGAAPLAPAYIFHYMADPQTIQPDIAPARMPRYDLTERERVALALFVTHERELRGVDDAFRAALERHPDADRGEGRILFQTLNCAGCHAHPEVTPSRNAPDLSFQGSRVHADWLVGYLSDPVTIRPSGPVPGFGGQMPDFRLAPGEVSAITGYLMDRSASAVAAWEPADLSPFSMDQAETLLRDRWSCLGCHQLGDDGGRIGPRLDGIRHRLQPGYVRLLIEDPAHLNAGVVMPGSLEQPDRLDLVASFLLRRDAAWLGADPVPGMPALPDAAAGPGATGAGAEAMAAAEAAGSGARAAGEALYQLRCAPCHGVEGRGDGFNAPFMPVAPVAHADSAAMSLRPDDTLYDGIHAGGWILGKSHRMPAFGKSLDNGQIRSLVAYIRTLCNCQGPAWSRDGRRP